MSEEKTYQGGCHCGKVRYEITADLSKPLAACNCSICSKMGWLLTFVPAAGFKLVSGEEHLRDYQFNKQNVHHLFCDVCGIRSFTYGSGRDGQKMYSVNVRCLDGVDATTLEVKHFDGKSL